MANAYEQSRARVSTIVGPTGGGKTVSSAKKVLRVAQWQHPSPRDGIRKARVTCVTPTYRQAWNTVIPSYKAVMAPLGVLDPRYGKFTGSKGDPADHVFDLRIPGLGQVHLEVLFRAINDLNLEEFVRGFETTAWWLPELDTLPKDLVGLAANRVGRYPAPADRPEVAEEVAYAGVFGDANVPDIDSWFYEQFWLPANRKAHWHLFRQPSGLSADAENIDNLRKIDPNYYRTMMADMERWAVRRFVECKPGYSRHGLPVHEDFDDERHVSKTTLEADPYLEVIIGVDGGGNTNMPGASLMQRSASARWRVLDEFAPDSNTSAQQLGAALRHKLNTRIRRARGAVIIIDPAAAIVSPLSPHTYAQQLSAASGIEVRLAPSQDPKLRRGGLKAVLQRFPGGQPDFLVDPSCSSLIRALAGGFRYNKRDKDKGDLRPVKNQHSHVAESCEYGVLGGEGLEGFFSPVAGGDSIGGGSADLYPEPIL